MDIFLVKTARRTICVVLFGMLIVSSVFLSRQEALARSASAGCKGQTCSEKDPQSMGCARDAVTLKSQSNSELRVEIRYSKICDASWSRVTNFVRRKKPITQAYVSPGDTTFVSRRASVLWSKMSYSSYNIYGACGRVILNDVGVQPPLCISK